MLILKSLLYSHVEQKFDIESRTVGKHKANKGACSTYWSKHDGVSMIVLTYEVTAQLSGVSMIVLTLSEDSYDVYYSSF